MNGSTSDANARARVTAVYLAVASGQPMKRVPEALAVEGRGLEGCRHGKKRPGTKRQVLLMDLANLRALDVELGAMKENLIVEGLPLEELPAGQRLQIGDAILELTEQCVPCHKMDKLRPGLLQQSYGRRGQLAKVIRAGTIAEGAEVRLLDVNPDAPRPIRPKLP